MIEPRTPHDEAERQAALERYDILDSLPERSYDDITALMADVCEVPISLVGLIDRDRHWLKSHHGIDLRESPRAISFCGHAIASGEALFTVEDAREDPRFEDNPLVTAHGAIGYAGAPLVDADGFALGALCVFSHQPLVLRHSQKKALKNMARQVMCLLERHLRERRLQTTSRELETRNDELKQFAAAVTHDLRSPMNNMVELARLIEEDGAGVLCGETLNYLSHLKDSSIALRTYVDGLLAHYTSEDLASSPPESFRLDELFARVDRMIARDERTTLVLPATGHEIRAHQAALQQVLLNLIANAVKYGAGTHTRIEVTFERDESNHRFSVTDDGQGIAPEFHESIFGLFATAGNAARDAADSTGIGLATVRKLLDRLGGAITLDSTLGQGSTFSFTLPRVAAPVGETRAA